ncbi:DUF2125 domain-containing protein [Bradyrhizobium sp.]|jgi:hypothetical protein|uniref:DUF2125 domain-containing protein n=1 Tax=Bradyrhizobium sp. TaxID=376 RepID=UPI002E08A037|nr:DUF2125 domain-containing protein [Bradyrhizobium sp.]
MSAIAAGPRKQKLWRLFLMPVLVLVAAIAWSAFWFYAASKVDESVDAWRAREAQSGRLYDCARRSVAGFPFRFEVRCSGASVALASQTAGGPQAPVTARLGDILVVAQVYDPKLLIAEFTAPASISGGGVQPLTVTWSKARSSIVGLPAVPQRAAIVFDDPAIDRTDASAQTPLARAKHVELHARLADGAAQENPVIETVLQIAGGSLHDLHPLLAEPFDADIRTLLSGLKDFSPKPWPQRFREIQAAGGHVEIAQSRIAQGDLIAVATGTLRLNAGGRIDGELQMTVAGLEKVIPALGIDKMLEQGVPQATLDRVAPGLRTQDINSLMGALNRAVPGLGNVVKQNANVGVAAGINALGREAVLEGRKARAFPLRFVDGAVFLGPLKVGQVPPLF